MGPNEILFESVWLIITKLPCVTLKSVLGQQLRDSFPLSFEDLLGFLTLTCRRVVHLNSLL